jgi:hypothetical protein
MNTIESLQFSMVLGDFLLKNTSFSMVFMISMILSSNGPRMLPDASQMPPPRCLLPDASSKMPLRCLLPDASSQMPPPRCLFPDASSQMHPPISENPLYPHPHKIALTEPVLEPFSVTSSQISHILSNPLISSHILSNPLISSHILSYPLISSQILSYPLISSHILPYPLKSSHISQKSSPPTSSQNRPYRTSSGAILSMPPPRCLLPDASSKMPPPRCPSRSLPEAS